MTSQQPQNPNGTPNVQQFPSQGQQPGMTMTTPPSAAIPLGGQPPKAGLSRPYKVLRILTIVFIVPILALAILLGVKIFQGNALKQEILVAESEETRLRDEKARIEKKIAEEQRRQHDAKVLKDAEALCAALKDVPLDGASQRSLELLNNADQEVEDKARTEVCGELYSHTIMAPINMVSLRSGVKFVPLEEGRPGGCALVDTSGTVRAKASVKNVLEIPIDVLLEFTIAGKSQTRAVENLAPKAESTADFEVVVPGVEENAKCKLTVKDLKVH